MGGNTFIRGTEKREREQTKRQTYSQLTANEGKAAP